MDGGLSIGTLMNYSALGLVLGTLFFASMGIAADRDFFLVLGLCTTALGDAGFAFWLWDQAPARNDEHATLYVCLAALSVYALCVQFEKYREGGCEDADVDEPDDAPRDVPTREVPARVAGGAASEPEPRHDNNDFPLRTGGGGVRRRRGA